MSDAMTDRREMPEHRKALLRALYKLEHLSASLRAEGFRVPVSASGVVLNALHAKKEGEQLVVTIELSNGHTLECRMRLSPARLDA
jgi:hypothetical protein